MQNQVKEFGQVLFSEVKSYREKLDLQILFEILQNPEAEMASVNESITLNKFIPGLNHQLAQSALILGIDKKFIKKELESLSLTYLKYISTGVLFEEEKRSYYKDFKERLEPSRLEESYSQDQKLRDELRGSFPQLHSLWMCYFRKESCVTYRRLRKAIYLYFYGKQGDKISKTTHRLEHYLAPIGYFSLNSQNQEWKFQCVEEFMTEFAQQLKEEALIEEIKQDQNENSSLYPDAEVKFELRFLFQKEGAGTLSSKILKEYSTKVTMNDHVYIGNSNPWYENDVELLTRKDFLDPNCTQLILLKGEPKGFPQVIDLSGIQVPYDEKASDQIEKKEQDELRLNSMNFFSYYKALEPVYRIRQGAIILIDTLDERQFKTIERLPIDLKSFYLWEKEKAFQIVDPWMEYLGHKENFQKHEDAFMVKDILGQIKMMAEIGCSEGKPVSLNQKFTTDKPTKCVVEFQRVKSAVVLQGRENIAKKGVNVGILMKKYQEFKYKIPSVPLKITQANISIQFQKAGLLIKFIKI